MRVFVNKDLLTYVANYYFGSKKGDSKYISEFDMNKDGNIDIYDIIGLSMLNNTWLELKA